MDVWIVLNIQALFVFIKKIYLEVAQIAVVW